MNPWWMLLILVGCRLSHNLHTENSCACKDLLKTVCVSAGDNVSVPCPNSDGEDVKFKLLHGGEVVSNYKCTKKELNCKPLFSMEGVELRENADNTSVGFMLSGVTASSHGIYRCQGLVSVPPPMMTRESDLRVLVLVKGHQCEQICRSNQTDEEQRGELTWIWIVASVSIYSVIITIIAIFVSVKLRRTDPQTDYMNTKPKVPRGRRKNKGVRNPIPHHF
ncbi:uncharacterized protein si:dkey-1h24.6 [Antennarius striatus]|uniref:uncharacterized protein si:dkey-1h24.6 n=1 Tax=Antennarius striatus TaxID=241820 RepID=UPI0035B39B89